jgi:small subunit ribosomal protein S9
MADEEQQDDVQPDEEPQAEAPQEEAAARAPEAPAEEPQAEEPVAETPEEAPADDPVTDAPDAPDEPAVSDPPDEADADAGEQPEEATPGPEVQATDAAPEAGEKSKAKDAAPGADLEPIALEPERELSAEERARAEAEAEERARVEAEQGEDTVAEEPVARKAVQLDAAARIQATGKRKNAIARVVVRQGNGTVEINSRSLEDYFPRHQHQTMARQPLVTAGYEGTVDVRVRVHGGGIGGQAGAVRHGIARALTEIDPELRGELKRRGYLTRDAREKERRKAGLKKARKRPQFSKR